MQSCFAQDTVVVHHKAYTTVFAAAAHIPAMVFYTLRKADLECDSASKRTNRFKADPEMPGTSLAEDYVHSGYDRGHNMSAEDNRCDEQAMEECFYYSNMFPQAPNLNRGVWKKLENQERQWALEYDSVIVYVGNYGASQTIGSDQVVAPAWCWKAIYVPALGQWADYIFPNEPCPGMPDNYAIFTPGQRQWMQYIIHKYQPPRRK